MGARRINKFINHDLLDVVPGMNSTWINIYNLRLAQPKNKSKAREAR